VNPDGMGNSFPVSLAGRSDAPLAVHLSPECPHMEFSALLTHLWVAE
jgi:hypothetical protein